MDISKYLDENGRPRNLTPEERAEIEALPPDERDELKQQIREAQLLAALNLNMACVYGPPSASGPAFLPPQPEAMLYGPPVGVGWCAGGFTGMIGAGMTMAEQQKAQQNPPPVQRARWLSKDTWQCICGSKNTGNFCPECGAEKPQTWLCKCGSENTGKFCQNCGSPKPEKP